MRTVTAIIPTYNRADLLPAAVDSVLAQDYPDAEIIVADDGSTDGTVALLKQRYGESVRIVTIEHSGLPAVARNAALHVANGEFIAFLDSDDRWLHGKLRRQMEIMESDEKIGLVSSDAFVERPGHRGDLPRFFGERESRRGRLLKELIRENFVIASTALVRRTMIDRAGSFCEDRRARAVEDYDLWLRIASISDIAYIPEPLAIYRDVADSIRSEQTLANYYEACLWILNRLRVRLSAADAYTDDLRRVADECEKDWTSRLREAYWDAGRYLRSLKVACCGFKGWGGGAS
jgi:glycosyltransferase involved in cell wall biosynthesis